jgi:hypothetical protein
VREPVVDVRAPRPAPQPVRTAAPAADYGTPTTPRPIEFDKEPSDGIDLPAWLQ